jgi:hypothetical protein
MHLVISDINNQKFRHIDCMTSVLCTHFMQMAQKRAANPDRVTSFLQGVYDHVHEAKFPVNISRYFGGNIMTAYELDK